MITQPIEHFYVVIEIPCEILGKLERNLANRFMLWSFGGLLSGDVEFGA